LIVNEVSSSASDSSNWSSDEYTSTYVIMKCGTSSGVILNFDKIEVVNRLKTKLAH
jgi:hypothetical protein